MLTIIKAAPNRRVIAIRALVVISIPYSAKPCSGNNINNAPKTSATMAVTENRFFKFMAYTPYSCVIPPNVTDYLPFSYSY
jgi:hypothetical protein